MLYKRIWKVDNIEPILLKVATFNRDHKVDNINLSTVNIIKIWTDHIIKLSTKTRDKKYLSYQKSHTIK